MAIKVISPSSYGEGKIYGISPSTPSINTDTTFTRASTKTRINNEGLVESVPYNLLQFSEEFDNAYWGKGSGTLVTSNNVLDPYGTQYADKIEQTDSSFLLARFNTPVNAGKITLSCYIKKGNFDSNLNFRFGFYGGGADIAYITYNFLTNSTSVRLGAVDNHGSIQLSNGWVRIFITTTLTVAQTNLFNVYLGGVGASINTGSFFYLWGAQLVEGSALQPYIRTTDRLNVPSIDYSLGTTNRPVLLLEPQRTNLALSGSTLPTQNITVTNVPHTFSFYGTGSTTLSGAFSDVLIGTGINNRSQLTFTPTGGTLTLTVNGTVSNAQLEVGSYATSYIPTTNASATRLADSFLSDFLFTNETVTSAGGTWFVDLDNNLPYVRDNSDVGLFLGDTTTGTTNSFAFNTPSGSSRLEIDKYVNGVATPLFNTTTDRVKAAIKWNGSTADVFVNGAKVVSGTTFTGTTLEFMGTTVRDTPKYIRGMWLAPVPLPDSDLLSETSPALFIDSFQSAALAFSFRKLRYSYTGPCIRVRRSSDSTEQDIGFVNDVLDEAALTTFVGASNGHVVTWYNQSINGIHLRQTTAANQPLIVVSGVTQKELGKPVILFGSGTTIALNLATPYTFSANVFSKSTVSKYTGSGSVTIRESNWGSSGTLASFYYTDHFRHYTAGFGSNQYVVNDPSIPGPSLALHNITHAHIFGGVVDDGIPQLISYFRNNRRGIPAFNSNRDQWTTNILFSPTPATNSSAYSYTVAEVVYWDGNLESSMNLIRANTNSYYNLYADGSRQFLLNNFSGAAAAYSVRSLNTEYTAPLIRVRRSSDNAETDIFANRNGDLDTSTLSIFCGSGNGFVTTWYDQSGNGKHAFQTTAINQPQIFASGSVILENGRVAINFNGVNNYLESLSVGTYNSHTFAMVFRRNLGYILSVQYNDVNSIIFWDQQIKYWTAATVNQVNPSLETINYQNLTFAFKEDSFQAIYNNNILKGSISNAISFGNTALNMQIGYAIPRNNTLEFLNGTFQEIIYYPTSKSVNRDAISNNINNYYRIY